MEERISIKVPLFLCDNKKRLRIDGLLKLLVEASVTNSERLEDGNNNNYWILYSWYIDLFEDIYWKDTLEVETFSRKIKGFYAFRNFNIYIDGKKVMQADTRWVLINSKELRIMKIPKQLADLYGSKDGFEFQGQDLKRLESYQNTIPIQVRKSDLDINGHVNNSVYLAYAMEGFSNWDAKIESIHIIYKKEIRDKESVTLSFSEEGNDFYFALESEGILHSLGHIKFS